MKRYILTLLSFISALTLLANDLSSGFSKTEYIETLKMNAAQKDTITPDAVFRSDKYDRIYRSPVVGLLNRWDLWMRKDKNEIGISLRGTAPEALSWLANFYAAMIPARGEIKINDSLTFNYKLAERSDATVHAGWTFGLGSMASDIVQKIDSCYRTGVKNVLIFGHSQGGALSHLTTAYLRYLQKDGKLPADIVFKTYASAAPKPGNLYFAYDYEHLTFGGWSYTVVNPEDWVPETPITVQTSEDFATTNPFRYVKPMLKKQKLLVRMALKGAYNSMDKSTKKARKNVKKQLGYRTGKLIQKSKPQYVQPEFSRGIYYTRAGIPVVLMPDVEYYASFPKDAQENIFQHHMFEPYLMLAEKLPETK
ncbi:hypothetical protein GCM10009118_18120 [Wandonia haliotis]|uniref:Fungal lipase-type domain-containing protein n=1 Tax=Wandonia haliotis TaxID=574963 RepID=A0ABP3Y3S6_9FLAO